MANSFPDSELLEVIRKVGVTFMPPATVGQVRASGCYAIFHYSRIQSKKIGQNWTSVDNSGSHWVSPKSTTSGQVGSKVAMCCGPVDRLDIRPVHKNLFLEFPKYPGRFMLHFDI